MHDLPTFLLNRTEREKIAMGWKAHLFLEFNLGAREQIFARFRLALRNAPRPGVFRFEERAAGMDEEQFELATSMTKE